MLKMDKAVYFLIPKSSEDLKTTASCCEEKRKERERERESYPGQAPGGTQPGSPQSMNE